MRRGGGGLLAGLAVGALFALGLAAPATAAIQIGEAFDAPQDCEDATIVQMATPGPSYAAPSAGVITSWTISDQAPTIRLKVARPVSGNTFTIVGESDLEVAPSFDSNTFATRIPVRAGDVIGYFHAEPALHCQAGLGVGYTAYQLAGDQPVGTTAAFTQLNGFRISVAATLEPDGDTDGFGDETQDNCPGLSNPGQNDADGDGIGDACDDLVAPQTTITTGPEDKTKAKTATFEFRSDEPATFNCVLDGKEQFKACGSPLTVRVKKGRHSFSVTAIDSAGNADPSPATDLWRVKKKKRRK